MASYFSKLALLIGLAWNLSVALMPILSVAQNKLTADEIRDLGLHRPADILQFLDHQSFNSLDVFTDYATFSSPLTVRQNWEVFFDETQVDISAFGWQNLNNLPIDIGQVDSVKVFSAGEIVNNEILDQKRLIFYFKNPIEWQATGRMWAKNNAGDPGPWLYTQENPPSNVERVGPDYVLTVSAPHFQVHGISNNDHADDEPLKWRLKTLYEDLQRVPTLRTRGMIIRANLNNLYFSALGGKFRGQRFSEFLGIEIPQSHRFYGGNLGFNTSINNEAFFSLEFNASQSQISPRKNKLDIEAEAHKSHLRGHATFALKNKFFRLNTSATVDYYRFRSSRFTFQQPDQIYGQVKSGISWLPIHGFVLSAGGTVKTSNGRTIFNLWQRHTAHGFYFKSSRQTFFPESAGLNWLNDSGAFPTWNRPDTLRPPAEYLDTNTSLNQYKLGWQDESTTHAWGISIRRDKWQDMPVLNQSFRVAEPFLVALDSLSWEQLKGTLVVLQANWQTSFGRPNLKFYLNLNSRYISERKNTDSWQDVWAPIPKHRLQMRLHLALASHFYFSAYYQMNSATFWPAYNNIQNATQQLNVPYTENIPTQHILGFAITKSFLKNHLQASFKLNNLLNQKYRAHPLGFAEPLSLSVYLKISI